MQDTLNRRRYRHPPPGSNQEQLVQLQRLRDLAAEEERAAGFHLRNAGTGLVMGSFPAAASLHRFRSDSERFLPCSFRCEYVTTTPAERLSVAVPISAGTCPWAPSGPLWWKRGASFKVNVCTRVCFLFLLVFFVSVCVVFHVARLFCLFICVLVAYFVVILFVLLVSIARV